MNNQLGKLHSNRTNISLSLSLIVGDLYFSQYTNVFNSISFACMPIFMLSLFPINPYFRFLLIINLAQSYENKKRESLRWQ